jgi:hypothetical protein
VIAHRTPSFGPASGGRATDAAGAPIWIDDQARIATKTMVIDEAAILAHWRNQLTTRCGLIAERIGPVLRRRRLIDCAGAAPSPNPANQRAATGRLTTP